MQWFKHDTNANQDTRIKRLRNRYGLSGYGLYFYVLERVVGGLNQGNVSLTLEDDPEMIAADWGITESEAKEMLSYMVELGLLIISPDGLYACSKVAKRLDKSMTNGRNMRDLVDALRFEHGFSNEGVPDVMTKSGSSHDKVMQEEKRKEHKTTQQNKSDNNQSKKPVATAQVVIPIVLIKTQSGPYQLPNELIDKWLEHYPETWLVEQLNFINQQSILGNFESKSVDEIPLIVSTQLMNWWKSNSQQRRA
jgi:hypothetical protein